MEAIWHLCSALGLSTAAGLNAYIPLLTVAIMANRHVIHLAPGYEVLAKPWCIAILICLLIVEIIVDKVPGADHINDMVHTLIRPAAGAVLFASEAGMITQVQPAVWIVLGLLLSGSVHGTKALARPVVNLATAGLGAPVVSVVEDFVSVTLAVVAVLVPVLGVVLLALFAWMLWKLFRRFFGKGRGVRVYAVPVPETARAGAG